MIVCKKCGFNNADADTFCGSCGAFLEWTGEKVVPPALAEPVPETPAAAEPARRGGFMALVQQVTAIGVPRKEAIEPPATIPGMPMPAPGAGPRPGMPGAPAPLGGAPGTPRPMGPSAVPVGPPRSAQPSSPPPSGPPRSAPPSGPPGSMAPTSAPPVGPPRSAPPSGPPGSMAPTSAPPLGLREARRPRVLRDRWARRARRLWGLPGALHPPARRRPPAPPALRRAARHRRSRRRPVFHPRGRRAARRRSVHRPEPGARLPQRPPRHRCRPHRWRRACRGRAFRPRRCPLRPRW